MRQEEADRNFALQLQKQQSTPATPASTNPFASTLDAGRTYSAPQVSFVRSPSKQCSALATVNLPVYDVHPCTLGFEVPNIACVPC